MRDWGKIIEDGPYHPLKSFQIPEWQLPMELWFSAADAAWGQTVLGQSVGVTIL